MKKHMGLSLGMLVLIAGGTALYAGCSSRDTSTPRPEPTNAVQQAGNPPHCGDGILNANEGEECDLGAANSDIAIDGCRTTECRWAYCGDGVDDTGESCDTGPSNLGWCRIPFSGYSGPTCIPNTCGNGYLNDTVTTFGLSEACDDHNSEDGDTCRSDCGQDLSKCGNGSLDQGEKCDLGAALNSNAPNHPCRTNCQVARCGDGIVDDQADPPEECDRTAGCGPDCKLL